MIVAIQKTLAELKNELLQKGYEVVDLETYKYPIDAMIYEGNTFQISHISRNNISDFEMGTKSFYGVFMINSTGKSINEIDDMLKSRAYTPLF